MIGASSLEIPSETLVLVFLILLPEFAGNSEVYKREPHKSIALDTSTDVFQLDVTVGILEFMESLQCLNYLLHHHE